MNHDDMAHGAPEPLNTEEAAELANVLPLKLDVLDDASQCRHCYGKGWNDEWKAVSGHYMGGEVFRVQCDSCEGSGK